MKWHWLTVLTLCLLPSAAMGTGPTPGAQHPDPEGRMVISPSDRCPVCAMLPSRFPRFAAAIQLTDGATYYFCSPGCMITAWLHPESYLGIPPSKRLRALASDYFTSRHTDAKDLWWVPGSDVVGPMGPAVVPLGNEEDVRAFRIRHGGWDPFTLEDLKIEQWEAIRSGRDPSP